MGGVVVQQDVRLHTGLRSGVLLAGGAKRITEQVGAIAVRLRKVQPEATGFGARAQHSHIEASFGWIEHIFDQDTPDDGAWIRRRARPSRVSADEPDLVVPSPMISRAGPRIAVDCRGVFKTPGTQEPANVRGCQAGRQLETAVLQHAPLKPATGGQGATRQQDEQRHLHQTRRAELRWTTIE